MARNKLPTLAICGHGRCGKDTVSVWLAEHTRLRYSKSTSEASAMLCYEQLKDKYGYANVQDAFADRHNHRREWAKCIWQYNQPDGLTLYRDMADSTDIFNGTRRVAELTACIAAGIVDLSIWIDRYVPIDPSCELAMQDCDIVIQNHTTLPALYVKLANFSRALNRF